MSLKERINEDLKKAMKARDKERTSVLRMLLSEIKYTQAAVNVHAELPEAEVLKVVGLYHKRMLKSLDDYPEGEKRDQIRSELGIVDEYLPKRASRAEVEQVVDEILRGTEVREFGTLMKQVLARLGTAADGKIVSEVLKPRLSKP